MKIKIDLYNAAIGSFLKYGLSTIRITGKWIGNYNNSTLDVSEKLLIQTAAMI